MYKVIIRKAESETKEEQELVSVLESSSSSPTNASHPIEFGRFTGTEKYMNDVKLASVG